MNSWPAVVSLGAAVAAILLFVIPPVHGAAWVIGIVLALIVIASLFGFAQQWAAAQDRIDSLNEKIARVYQDAAAVRVSQDSEPAHPDTESAERIRELFPQDSGLIQELRISISEPFTPAALAPLDTFLSEFEHSSFTDSSAHSAFMNLFRSAQAVSDWFAQETSADAHGSRTITQAAERTGGWHEFSTAQARGEKLGNEFVATRFAFDRVVRETGIVER